MSKVEWLTLVRKARRTPLCQVSLFKVMHIQHVFRRRSQQRKRTKVICLISFFVGMLVAGASGIPELGGARHGPGANATWDQRMTQPRLPACLATTTKRLFALSRFMSFYIPVLPSVPPHGFGPNLQWVMRERHPYAIRTDSTTVFEHLEVQR